MFNNNRILKSKKTLKYLRYACENWNIRKLRLTMNIKFEFEKGIELKIF
jgi:hypothetical protein